MSTLATKKNTQKIAQSLPKNLQALFLDLDDPRKIQEYLESIPFNHEENGETCVSPRGLLHHKKAHCMEGALFAYAALRYHKKNPKILSLRVTPEDYDHVVVLFKEHGYYGAISKTNHAVLGWRDPVYTSPRELAMSYFHEYFLTSTGEKTLRAFSSPISLQAFGEDWITSEENLFSIAEAIYDSPHKKCVPPQTILRHATPLQRRAANISEEDNRTLPPLEEA